MAKKNDKRIDSMEKVDIGFFLKQLCGIVHSDVGKMTHEAVRTFFPELKRTSFAHVLKNPELLQTGRIVLVRDAQLKPIPYMVPQQPIMSIEEIPITKEEQFEEIFASFEQLVELSSNALLLFEGNDLLDRYISGVKRIHGAENRDQLSTHLIAAAVDNRGLIVGRTGNIYSYHNLQINGAELYEEDLATQASMLTMLVDAYAMLVDDENQMTFVFDGIKYHNQDQDELKLMLEMSFVGDPEHHIEETRDIKNYSLSTMTIYELSELMKYYKRSGQTAYYHTVRRELIKKTESTKKFKERKEKQKRKDKI